MPLSSRLLACSLLLILASGLLLAQNLPPFEPPSERPNFRGGPPGFGGGPGGFGPRFDDMELVGEFDQNDDGWLNLEERSAARASVEERRARQPRRGPGRGPRGSRRDQEPAGAGRRLSPDGVVQHPSAPLYDNTILRTIFLEFESDDWEQELEAFKDTDVEVPAIVIVDGRTYPNVGVHFRGMSSYMMTPRGKKRSLNLSFDFLDEEQRLYGYKTLNLLNCAGDASMMSAVLYAHIAREYIPTPRANFVQVVINGESWGVYANVQQFDKIFLGENFDPSQGTRWKAPGNPGGDAGLRYLGEDLEEYKQRFDMKSNDGKKAWEALVELCRVLNLTPEDQLAGELDQVLDIDETLRFLALDVALVNSDGYWTRASDYNLYRGADGRFQLIPHDTNEAFGVAHGGPPGGPGRGRDPRRGGRTPREDGPPRERQTRRPPPGFPPPDGFGPPPGFGPPRGFGRGGPEGFGHGGPDLDPLIVQDRERMPLRGRLLAIPTLRDQYLGHVQAIARDSLDWETLGPFVESQRQLIDEAVTQDTKKLVEYEEFVAAVADLQDFAQKRRAFLLEYRPSEGEQ